VLSVQTEEVAQASSVAAADDHFWHRMPTSRDTFGNPAVTATLSGAKAERP